MKVSLIIPAYNEEKYIGSCLDYAIKNSHGWFHEIIVIDNNCTDRTKEIAEGYPGVRVVQEPKKALPARAKGAWKKLPATIWPILTPTPACHTDG